MECPGLVRWKHAGENWPISIQQLRCWKLSITKRFENFQAISLHDAPFLTGTSKIRYARLSDDSMKKNWPSIFVQEPTSVQSTSLLYLETSPTFCAVTKGRNCQHPENCAMLCCGRGYSTHLVHKREQCRCRFSQGQCCHVVCDYCESKQERYFCK